MLSYHYHVTIHTSTLSSDIILYSYSHYTLLYINDISQSYTIHHIIIIYYTLNINRYIIHLSYVMSS